MPPCPSGTASGDPATGLGRRMLLVMAIADEGREGGDR
jgi:hypothetical protein